MRGVRCFLGTLGVGDRVRKPLLSLILALPIFRTGEGVGVEAARGGDGRGDDGGDGVSSRSSKTKSSNYLRD